jgi:hypothetical protein
MSIRMLAAVAALVAAVSVNAQCLLSPDDAVDDTNPAIYGKGVVWVRDNASVMYWNGKTTTEIYSGNIDAAEDDYIDRLASAGKLVAWAGNGDIYVWNGKAVTRLTDDAYEDSRVATDGKWVVWQKELSRSEIMLWDGKTVTQLTDNDWGNAWPDVSKGRVVWRADGDGGPDNPQEDIMLWEDGVAVNLCTQLSVYEGTDDRPVIEGNLIAWIGENDVSYTVYLYDGIQLQDLGNGTDPQAIVLSGGTVTWQERDDNVYAWRKGTLTPLGEGRYPCAYGDLVAWSLGANLNIVVHNLKKGTEIKLTSNSNADMASRLGKGRIAWQCDVAGKGKIFTFPGPQKMP